MRMPNALSKKSLDETIARYQANLGRAASYLEERCIPLPVAEMFRFGVVTHPAPGHEHSVGRLAIPYLTPTGPVGITFRCMQLHNCKQAGHEKYLKPAGQEDRVFNVGAFSRATDSIALCEGELDAVILDGCVGIPAVGVSGAKKWQPHYAGMFSGYSKVYVYADPDEAGRALWERARHELRNAELVKMPDGMDVNKTYCEYGAEWFW